LTDVQSWSPCHSGYFWSVDASDDDSQPSSSSPSTSTSTSASIGPPPTWQHLVDRESERLAKQQEAERLFTPTKTNCKDDTTAWLPMTGWEELFKGKDLEVLFVFEALLCFALFS
jgi:hypothetical protein